MSERFLDYEGLARVLRKTFDRFTSYHAISFKGAADTISTLPPLSIVDEGWMYSVKHGGQTTDDFVEGPGKILVDGESVVSVNVGTVDEPVMKWDAVGGIFDISDRLQFGLEFPVSAQIGDPFLYLGDDVFEYSPVTPTGTENPSKLKWYEYNAAEDIYVPSEDTEVDPLKTYYSQTVKYKKCVIYVYSVGNNWAPQQYGDTGDTVTSIDSDDIAALFL